MITWTIIAFACFVVLTFFVALEFMIDAKDIMRTYRTLRATKRTDVKDWGVELVTLVNGGGKEKKLINAVEFSHGDYCFLIEKKNDNKDVCIHDKGGWVQKGKSLEYEYLAPGTLLALLMRKRIRRLVDKRGDILLDIHIL